MSQFDQRSHNGGIMNEQQFNQLANALYSYCKVMRVPKLGVAPVVITVLEGVVMTLLTAALGVKIWWALLVGALVCAVFAFLCWLAYRYRAEAAKRLNSYLAADGGQGMLIDFASARPFASDQFRLGTYFLYIKNGAVLRLDGITDVVKTTSHYRAIPTGVYLSITVEDASGKTSFPLCRVHLLKAEAEVEEIRQAVLQKSW